MNKAIFAIVSAGALLVLGCQALAHDGYDDADQVYQVNHYWGGDVVHYDHHHYAYDRYGNEIVIHHDHHYVVPNDDNQRRHDSYHRRDNLFGFFFGR